MSEDFGSDRRDAALWRRARAAWIEGAGPAEAPDPTTLAAYLDGGLDAAARDRVEAWMAASEEALDLVIAAREALAAPAGEVPDGFVRRAQGIVAARPAPAGPGGSAMAGLGAWLGGFWRPAAWAGAAAAVVLLASASGFELGRVGVAELAALDGIAMQDLDLALDPGADDLL